jgi:ribose 5-phosphate isomerase B
MRIALGADHAGVALKREVARLLDERGIPYTDFGTSSTESVDYPDFAAVVGREVASGAYDRGILVCGTGTGMAIAANKIPPMSSRWASASSDWRSRGTSSPHS